MPLSVDLVPAEDIGPDVMEKLYADFAVKSLMPMKDGRLRMLAMDGKYAPGTTLTDGRSPDSRDKISNAVAVLSNAVAVFTNAVAVFTNAVGVLTLYRSFG